jgi:hypothetical protein
MFRYIDLKYVEKEIELGNNEKWNKIINYKLGEH